MVAGQADRDAARGDPRASCCWAWPCWPGVGTSARGRTRPSSARSWPRRSGGTGPTTSCPSPSPSSWRWPPTPRSAACPILASLLARDNYLPHLFALRGDRQVFANGIWVLAGLSAVLLIAVGGNTNELIPLFAIGVFTGFTLSQTGLVVHWWRTRPPRWRPGARPSTALGAVVTGLATVIFLVSKFTEGAWVVVVAVPTFVVPLHPDPRLLPAGRAWSWAWASCPAKPQGKRTLVDRPGDQRVAPHPARHLARRSRSARRSSRSAW